MTLPMVPPDKMPREGEGSGSPRTETVAKKAHHRFKHLAKEQGFLACQLDSQEGWVG